MSLAHLSAGATRASPQSPRLQPTRLHLQEHDWLHALAKSGHNHSPAFRFPDLIGACVSHLFQNADADTQLFHHLRTVIAPRPADTARRQADLWQPHFDQLVALQRCAANQYPHPRFQLDQLTTACVALARMHDASGLTLLRQARANASMRWT